MSFDLEAALAGLDAEKATAIKEKFHNLESGFTKATQERSNFERAVQEKDGLLQQQGKALQGYETFYNAWAQEQAGKVTPAGAPPTRQEASLPEEYEPNALRQSIRGMLQDEMAALNASVGKTRQEMEAGLYGALGNLTKWQEQLAGIKAFDPEADRNLLIKTAQDNGLNDLNAAYRVAYFDKAVARAAKLAAEQAAPVAAKEAEMRVRKELAQQGAQIEGASSMASGAARKIYSVKGDATVPKTRAEAETRATQDLYSKMYGAS